MKKFVLGFMISMLAATGAAVAGEQPAQPAQQQANSLDQLLEQVRRASREQNALNQRREQEFRQARDQQRQMLQRAQAALTAEEERSNRLRQQFDVNEQELTQLSETLRTRLGNLGEVFGVVRQMAGNAKSMVDNSLVSAQIDDRGQILSKLAQSSRLPKIEELEALTNTFLEEMVQSGKIVRFTDTVITEDGTPVEQDVVRVGVFNAINQNGFLRYLPETQSLVELNRQPAGRFVSMAGDLFGAEPGTGPIQMAVDPTQGTLLGALVLAPSFKERVDQGGVIGYITLSLGAFGLLIALQRLIYLWGAGRKIKAQVGSGKPSPDNALGRVLSVYNENKNDDIETLELKIDEAILKETPQLEKWQGALKIIAAVAPLLGLLGTVTGMILTFESITLFGTGDPKLMAGGISTALITTVEGLVVAIPMVLLHAIVSSRSRELVQIIEEQSAGIIAAHAEKQK
ncbi:MAG TPA: MotA/TolQ/ExbB proton channel family protein [Gammaproteobacteria bacterium]|nr:MotA/TolQ/ExbB proton channel family protein [Gammaproteobacteria bacterium]